MTERDPRTHPEVGDTWISRATRQKIAITYTEPPWVGLDWGGKPCQTTIAKLPYLSRAWDYQEEKGNETLPHHEKSDPLLRG